MKDYTQKEDTILLYIGYHSIPKQNTTHLEGQGDLVSRSIRGITRVTIRVIGVMNPLIY